MANTSTTNTHSRKSRELLIKFWLEFNSAVILLLKGGETYARA